MSRKPQENKHVVFWIKKKKKNPLDSKWKPQIHEGLLNLQDDRVLESTSDK